jgi:hypothetical protein
MTGKYATATEVPADRSRAEIEKTLLRYGADSFAYGMKQGKASVQFEVRRRLCRFILAMPDPKSREFTLTPTGKTRAPNAALEAYEQATRQRWRALLLLVKATLEAVESGIVSFEDAFLPYTVLPSGKTVADEVGVAVATAYEIGSVAPLQIGAGKYDES